VLERDSPAQSLQALAASRTFFNEPGMVQRLARLQLASGRALVAAGRPADAEANLLDGIRLLEAQRARLANGELSLQYFNLPWNLFDEMIALKAAAPGTSTEALSFAERARARSLLDSAAGSARAPLTDPASLAVRLPPDSVVIYYASLDRVLLAWVIRAQGVVAFQRPLGSDDLARQVADLHAALRSDRQEDFTRISERLFDELIRPATLPAGTRLIVVPDGALHAVPLAALRDRVSGRYLIEDHDIALAPSATMLERASVRLDHIAGMPRADILVLANPTLSATNRDRLPALDAAEAEARDIRAVYDGAVVLTGAAATKRAFVDTAGRFAVVHFGGHALANAQYPHLSQLLLAPDAQDASGALFAHEISLMRLPATALVVLAACNTAGGSIAKGEGPISLARPFLAIGVPAVVATLWDVKDTDARALFEQFYRSLRQGDDPAIALRRAQLALLSHSDSTFRTPGAWAGFVAMGGVRLKGGRQ
jgi:CHAT domain-containing protein